MFTIEKGVAQSAAKVDTSGIWRALSELEDIQYRLYGAVDLLRSVHSQITGEEKQDVYTVSETTMDSLFSLYCYLSDLSEKELANGIGAVYDALLELKKELSA